MLTWKIKELLKIILIFTLLKFKIKLLSSYSELNRKTKQERRQAKPIKEGQPKTWITQSVFMALA